METITLAYRASVDGKAESIKQVFDPKPLRHLATKDRHALGLGPTFNIKLGDRMIATGIPKRAAMAMSNYFNDVLTKYPNSTTIWLNEDDVSEKYVSKIVNFMTGNAKSNGTFALRDVNATFSQELELYRRAVYQFKMGHHAHVMRESLTGYLERDIPSYASLDAVLSLPDTDPVYKCAVSRMQYLQHKGELDGDDEWFDWLNENSSFDFDMDEREKEVKEQIAKKRQGQRVARAGQREVQRKADFETDFPPLK